MILDLELLIDWKGTYFPLLYLFPLSVLRFTDQKYSFVQQA